jgi:hypothetical protein
VTIAWIAEDERSSYAEATLAAIADDIALVPAIWHWEVSLAKTSPLFGPSG